MSIESLPETHAHYRLQHALLAAEAAQDEADKLWDDARQSAREASVFVFYRPSLQRD
jgi:hypothetical protein